MIDGNGRPARPRVSTVRLRARGEDVRVVQVEGNLFVCSRSNGNCCCGWEEKGRFVFDNSLWADEWERRRVGGAPLRTRLHLTFSGCLGPCAAGNNALLQIHGRSIWLEDLNGPQYPELVFDYAQAMLESGRVLPPPPELRDHVYERYLPPPEAAYQPLVDSVPDPEGLARLDPVCLMDVDPATARWRADHDGRTYVFCCPSCRRIFLSDPAAYATA